MYVTIKEATELLGVSRVTVYSYIKRGLLRTDPDSKETKLNIEDVYKIREEKRS